MEIYRTTPSPHSDASAVPQGNATKIEKTGRFAEAHAFSARHTAMELKGMARTKSNAADALRQGLAVRADEQPCAYVIRKILLLRSCPELCFRHAFA